MSQLPRTFIKDQPLFLLKEADVDRRWQAVLCEGEPRDHLRDNFVSAVNPGLDEVQQKVWHRQDRDQLVQLLADPPADWRRVALVCSAGLGKTTTLRALEYQINAQHHHNGKQLAVFLELDEITDDADALFETVRKKLNNNVTLQHRHVEALKKRRHEGRITLLFDSLDQAGADPDGTVMRALRSLLKSHWANCPFWVSGRPHAFEGNRLFFSQEFSWQFLRIGQFDEPEKRFYLDTVRFHKQNPNQKWTPSKEPEHFYQELPKAAQKLAAVPRYAALIGRMGSQKLRERLKHNATAADVYWTIYTEHATEEPGILQDGLKAKDARWLAYRGNREGKLSPPSDFVPYQIRRAADILGAIAFDMLLNREWNGVKREWSGFTNSVRNRFLASDAFVQRSGKPETVDDFFDDDFQAVLAMNSVGLDHLVFSTSYEEKSLRWADISVMAFFAAYWCCKWGWKTPEDTAKLVSCIHDPLNKQNEEFREFWQFAIDFPREAIREENWQKLFGLLYDRELTPIRSTEFIYRSWERMKGTQPQEKFLAEFEIIRAGEIGADKKQIADDMIKGFIILASPGSKLPDDTGTFWMGATKRLEDMRAGSYDPNDPPPVDSEANADESPPHRVTLSSYQLHRHCVRNIEYELFSEEHQLHRWANEYRNEKHGLVEQRGEGADDNCPVVNVSWYDAWVFAAWCGCVLPTEAQWEYACRAGTKTRYSLRDHSGEELTEDVCNYNSNLGYTLQVSDLGENRWGFYQMHGNVWEWCQDWYAKDYYGQSPSENPKGSYSEQMYKIVRGGSWSYFSWCCRVSLRGWNGPGHRSHDDGFRLASCLDFS